jgi:hypothetical protein
MIGRNLSPQRMFADVAAEHEPECAFAATDAAGAARWREGTLPKVLATLGRLPERVDPQPELVAEWLVGPVRRQKWWIDVGPHISATLLVNRPAEAAAGERLPVIACWYGHGPFGKDTAMSSGSGRGNLATAVADTNGNYGYQLAAQGYLTFAIDWMGQGERNDSSKPQSLDTNGSRDWCNLLYLNATLLGMTPLGMNLVHGMTATDVVLGFHDADPNRLGVMGISGGGTMALWHTLVDDRVRATEIICYSDLFAAFGLRDLNYCGMQITPGLYRLVDLPDLQGLLAPRPLLVDIGAEDDCFVIDTAMQCHRRVRHIYDTFGASDALELDLHPGPHAWGGNQAPGFFQRHLASG